MKTGREYTEFHSGKTLRGCLKVPVNDGAITNEQE
jgi:hypothetical protein